MAISSGDIGSANTGTGSATTRTIAFPTAVAGRVIIVTCCNNSGTGATNSLSGGGGTWVQVGSHLNQSTTCNQDVFYYVMDGNESGNFTITCSGTFRMSDSARYYDGVDPNNPIAGFAQGTGSASTTLSFAAATPLAETAYPVLCSSDRNTTASNVGMTQSSGYSNITETSTTNTAFIHSAIQDGHSTYTLPIASVTPGSATLGNSANRCTTVIFLRPDISGTSTVQSDVITPLSTASASTTNASTSFDTGYAEVLMAIVMYNSITGTLSSIANTSGLTWTQRAVLNNSPNAVEIWTAQSTGALSSQTVTATFGGAVTSKMQVTTIKNGMAAGTNPIGATNTGSGTSATSYSASVTTTVNNSWVYGALASTSTVTFTAGASQDTLQFSTANTHRGIAQRRDALTASSGTPVAISGTMSSATYVMAVVEVLPQPNPVVSDSITVTESVNISVQAASGAQTINVSDSITASESVGRLLESNRSVSDSITLTESSKAELNGNIPISDSVTITESIGRLLTSSISVSDNITITENTSILIPTLLLNVSDSITATESVKAELNSFVSTSDNVTTTESVQIDLPRSISVSDSVTITENNKTELNSFVSKSDSITITESVNAFIPTLVIAVSESIGITEALTMLLTSFVNKSESITVTENSNLQFAAGADLAISVSDSISITESFARQLQSRISTSDSVTVSESTARLLTSFITKSYNVTITESVNQLLTSNINKSDSITITENVQTTSDARINVSDNIAISESIGRLLTSFISRSDSVTISENVSASIDLGVVVSDSMSIDESIELDQPVEISVSEDVTIDENIEIERQAEKEISLGETISITEDVSVKVGAEPEPEYPVRRRARSVRSPREYRGSRWVRPPRGTRPPRL